MTVQQMVIVPDTDAPMKHHLYHEEKCAPRNQPDLSRLRRQTVIPSGALVTSGSGVGGHLCIVFITQYLYLTLYGSCANGVGRNVCPFFIVSFDCVLLYVGYSCARSARRSWPDRC